MAVRLIDANAMLNELRPVSFESEHSAILLSDVSKMMREWVERQPTLTPTTEWVSVENALPEECANILLCRKILKIPEIGTYQQARFWVYDEIGDVYQVDDVTHWLPIPTPYDIEHIHISEPPEG